MRKRLPMLFAATVLASAAIYPEPAAAIPVSVFVAIGMSTLAATATAFVVNTAISMAISKLLSPKVKSNRQAQVQTLQIGEQPRNAIIGECAHAGGLLHAFNYGGKYGTDWEMRIVAVADHRCHSLSGYFVNDKYVSHAGNGVSVPGYNGQLKVWFLPGTQDQVLPAELLSNCPMLSDGVTRSWTAADNCAGIALFIAAYKADKSDAKNPVWTAGRPNFLPVVKGAFLYDPRKDGTVPGGSGSHRRNIPSTWEWSDNLAIGRYNWQRGFYACDRVDEPDMLLVGRGLSAIEAPPERVFAAANLCDEIAEDGQRRWRCDAVIYATDQYIDTEEAFAAACAGIIVQREGGVEVIPGHAQSVVAEITDADLLIDGPVEYERERGERDEEWCNTVVGRYIEPSMKWGDHAAPVRRDLADISADGEPRDVTLSLQFCTRVNQAQYAAEYKRRLGRLTATATIPLGPRFIGLEEGDWIGWTSPRRWGGRKVFRIESWSFDKTRKSKRILREIAAGAYGTVGLLADQSVANQPPPPDFAAPPDSNAWSLSALMVVGDGTQIPTLRFAGATEDDGASAILFDYAAGSAEPDADDDATWTSAGSGYPSTTSYDVTGLAAGTTYWGGVSYLAGNVRSDRLVLGPVVMPGSGSAGRWTTQSGGRWLTQSGGQWLLEN